MLYLKDEIHMYTYILIAMIQLANDLHNKIFHMILENLKI